MHFCTQTDFLWFEQGLAGAPLGWRLSPLGCGSCTFTELGLINSSLSFPATLGHGLLCILLTGGTSPGGWICPIPGAVKRFLQQDVHHFIWRLHLTPWPVGEIMNVTLLYLCSSPSIVINLHLLHTCFCMACRFCCLRNKKFDRS